MNIAAFAATGIQKTGTRLDFLHFGTGAAEEGKRQVSRQSREKRSPEKKTISCPNPDSAGERGVVSSCHIWLGSIQRRPGHCEAHTPVCAELLLVSSIDLWVHG
jgi:hypothetical protein